MSEYNSTKRGKPLKRRWWTGYGFQWFGKDDKGVSIWEGQPKTLRFGYVLLGILGTTLLLIGAVLAAMGRGIEPALPLVLGGAIHLTVSWWMRRHHSQLSSMGTPADLAERLGVEQEELNRLAEENGILPRAIINQRPFYDPADFGDAGLLLRASSSPSDSSSLLRAAENSPGSAKNLLLPADEPGSTGQPASTSTPKVGDDEYVSQESVNR